MKKARRFAIFETAIGPCGIVWTARGVAGVQLPEEDERRTRERLQRRFPGVKQAAPPRAVELAREAIVALLAGKQCDLSDVELDMEGVPGFDKRVYEIARTIPAGATVSYGEIAAQLGERGVSRAVGQALGRNPFPLLVPCHRVLAAGGNAGGFSAPGGVATKLRLLAIEGVELDERRRRRASATHAQQNLPF